MNEKAFCESVASILEVESIGPDDDFRAVEGWCSLKAFGILVMMENDFGTPLTVADLARCRTVGDLFHLSIRR